MRARLVAATLLSLTTACSSSKSEPPPPPAVSLAFVSAPGPSGAVSPLAPAVQVELRDAAGHVVATSTASVTLALAPGAGAALLAGTTTATAVAGVATFADLRIARAGTGYRLAASSTGLTGATSAAFDVAVGPPAQLSVVAQPGDGRTSTALSPALAVTLQDAVGNPIDGGVDVTVTLGSGPSGGVLTGTPTLVPAAGQASFSDLAIRGAGAYTLRAQAGGLSATTAAFTLTDAWRSIGPDGGLASVAADPASPLTAIAGSPTGAGLWRTTDGGGSWTPLDTVGGRTLTPIFEKAGTVWAYGDSVWRSADGGATWTESAGLGLSRDGVVAGLAFDPVTHVTYMAIRDYEQRLLSSSDGGLAWAPVAPALPAGATLLAVEAGPGGLYVLSSQGFHALPRGASSWTAPVSVDTNPYRMAAHPTDPAVILVAGIFGLHRTTDGGATWTQASPYLFKDVRFEPGSPSKVTAVALSVGLFQSSDGGATFTSAPSPVALNMVSISGTASRLYLGADTGPFVSTDGGATWVKASIGLRASAVTAVAVAPGASPVLLAGNDAGELHRSLDGGTTWTRVLYRAGQGIQRLVFDPATPSRAYLANGGYPMSSTDGGATWADIPGSPPGIGNLALCRGAPGTLWVSDSNGTGVWRTTDGGATWARVYTRPSASVMAGDVAADAVDPLVGYMKLIDYGPGGAGTGVYRTLDAGATWTKLAISSYGGHLLGGPQAGSLWSIAGYSVARSADLGATFTPATLPSLNGTALSLAIDPSGGARALLGTVTSYAWLPGDGVTITTDGGATWVPARSGHDRFSTYSVAIDPGTPQTVYAGTYGGGLLKSTTGGL